MKRLAVALAVFGCAAPAADAGPGALRGCWMEQRGDQAVTQRWFPRPDGTWRGDELTYFKAGAPEPARWRLEPDGAGGWRMCMEELSMMSSPPCWRAFFGSGREEDGDDRWVEIEAAPDTLRIVWITAGERAIMYDGRRDGCD